MSSGFSRGFDVISGFFSVDDGGFVVDVGVFLSFHLSGEMGQELEGPNRQGTGDMNIFRRKEELADKIFKSVKAENHLGFRDRQLIPAINHLIETYGLDDAFEWITKDNYAVLVNQMLESPLKGSDKLISSSPLSGKRVQRKLGSHGVAVVRCSDNATELRSRPLSADKAELGEPMLHSTPISSDSDARKKQHTERHRPTDGSTKSKKAKSSNIYSNDTSRAVPISKFLEPRAHSVNLSSEVHKVKVPVPSFGEMEQGTSAKRKWSTQTTPKHSSPIRNEEPYLESPKSFRTSVSSSASSERRKGINPQFSLSPPMIGREARRRRSALGENPGLENHLSSTHVHEKQTNFINSINIDHHKVLAGDRREADEKITLSTEKLKGTLKGHHTEKVEVRNESGQGNGKWPRDSPMKEREGRRSRYAHGDKGALEKHVSSTVMHGKHIMNIDDHEKVLPTDRRDFKEKKILSTEKLKGAVTEHIKRKVEDQNDLAQDHRIWPRDSDKQNQLTEELKRTSKDHFAGKVELSNGPGCPLKDQVPIKQRSVISEKCAFEKQNLASLSKNVSEENKTRLRDQIKSVSYKQTIPSEQFSSTSQEDHLQKSDFNEKVQGQSYAKSVDSVRPCLKKPKKKSASLSENIIPPQETKIMDSLNTGEAVCVQKEPIAQKYSGQNSQSFLQELKTLAAGRLKIEMDPKAYRFFCALKGLEQRKGKAAVLPNLACNEDQRLIQKGTSETGQLAQKKENPAVPSDGDGVIVCLDISRGREKRKITCVNEYDDTCFPDNFLYITSSVITDGAHVDQSLSRIGDMHCSCSVDCLLSSTPCKCTGDTRGEYAYDKNGLLIPRLAYNYCSLDGRKNRTDFITECNVSCPCDSFKCGNRVVQRGLKYRLQVFMTKEGKGWGVRTLEPIVARSFLFEYIGEIMTNSEQYYRNIEYRQKNIHTYTMLLDADYDMEINHFKDGLNDDEALTLDATRYGNVSRFVNHRCEDPNLLLRPVQIDTRDTHYYHVAFFASRDIAKMEELTWDYNINFDVKHEVKGFRCLCGSSFCRDKKNKAQKKG